MQKPPRILHVFVVLLFDASLFLRDNVVEAAGWIKVFLLAYCFDYHVVISVVITWSSWLSS